MIKGLGSKIMGGSPELIITLPHTMSRDTMYTLVKTLFEAIKSKPRRVVLDFKKLERLQVGGVTVLSNMIELYRKAGIKTKFINSANCGARLFLQGSGFSAIYLGAPPVRLVDSMEFLPLKLVEYSRSHSYVHNDLIPWLAVILKSEPRTLSSLRVCFEEIFNNIKDHSTVEIGCSCAHFNEQEGMITICISDFGVGIPHKVRSKIEISSDQGAIAMACQEGFTTQSTPGNMGAGLHVLIRNVVTRNSGSVIICSGKGIYTCFREQQGGKEKRSGKPTRHANTYPGTLIYVTLETKKFVPSEVDEEEFAWE